MNDNPTETTPEAVHEADSGTPSETPRPRPGQQPVTRNQALAGLAIVAVGIFGFALGRATGDDHRDGRNGFGPAQMMRMQGGPGQGQGQGSQGFGQGGQGERFQGAPGERSRDQASPWNDRFGGQAEPGDGEGDGDGDKDSGDGDK